MTDSRYIQTAMAHSIYFLFFVLGRQQENLAKVYDVNIAVARKE